MQCSSLAFPGRIQHGTLGIGTSQRRTEEKMVKYVCGNCGYVYDPAEGNPGRDVNPVTRFRDLPDDWLCRVCGAEKWRFAPQD